MPRLSVVASLLVLAALPAASSAAGMPSLVFPKPAFQTVGIFRRGQTRQAVAQRASPPSVAAQSIRTIAPDGSVTIRGLNIHGWTFWFRPVTVRADGLANRGPTTDPPPSYDNSNQIQDELNLQNMIRTQDMINNQLQNDRMQDTINTQNMINTQQMIDTQNMINAQNAMDAQNAMNAQMNQ